MSERVIGYILITIGVVIIVVSAVNVVSVFNGSAQPVSVFSFDGISLDFGNLLIGDATPQEAQIIREQNPELSAQLVEANMINQPLNLFAHIILMGFMVNIGFKLASLGTMLVRPIRVNVKSDN